MFTRRCLIACSFALAIALAPTSRALAQAANGQAMSSPQFVGSCDLQALAQSEAEFVRLSKLRPSDPSVTDDELRRAAADYVLKGDACYAALYGGPLTTFIDDGGLIFGPIGSEAFNTTGRKWGAGSPYTGGANVPGPRLPGGTVTYSFMAGGISMAAENADASLAVTSLPTYSSCFYGEITNAFAAWSAVANIQFVEVADNGAAFNAAGAAGDIRVGAHTFDGPSSVLAHAYFPPPNGVSAAGDLHFDRAENWACSPGAGAIDIGIVAIHEVGHSIGLNHEQTNAAIMRPFYNPAVTVPLIDDINGAVSIYGPAGRRRVVSDFDGDGKTDIAVWRPSSGIWYDIRSSDGVIVSTQWGAGYAPYNDVSVEGDFDGDGKTDPAVWRASTGVWWALRSSDGTWMAQQWGAEGDVPVPGDFDGDGKTDVAVWRSSDGMWYALRSSDGTMMAQQWGLEGDVPVSGDFDGDRKTDVAVWRPSTGVWYALRSSDGTWTGQQWGSASSNHRPVPGDFDGDGKTDVAVWSSSDGWWYALRSSDGTMMAQQWGAGYAPYNDVPVPGDFDGDGKADVAVWRDSTGVWYIIRSSDGSTVTRQWGTSGDKPVPAPAP